MTVSKSQAIAAGYKHTLFHQWPARGECPGHIAPKWRSNGLCKTWARKPEAYRLPIKRGLREFGYITDANASDYHLVDDCPALVTAHDIADHATGVHNLDRLMPGWDEE